MATTQIGRTVATTLAVGHAAALVLVIGPFAGGPEHVITGTVLLACAASWAMLARQRWAVLPACFMGVAGAGLLVFAPSGSAVDALGWVWPPLWIALVIRTAVLVHRSLHSRSRWLVFALLAAYMLAGVGGGYQTIGEALDRHALTAPGELVDVGGHLLHLSCSGSGTPTVVLEAGLGEPGASWGWISPAVAAGTRVCVYDRAGRGWSDSSPSRQDGVAVATDLHTLLARAHVPAPYVLVGHSTGAQYVRIFAGRYPEQVAGMVLLDGQPAEALEGLSDFPAFYNRFRRISALLPSLARLGVARLVFHSGFNSLPAPARQMQRLSHSSARLFVSLRDEFAALPTSLAQARSFQSLGDRPLVVVTASQDAQRGWFPLQDGLVALSTNSSHRVVPHTHEELVTDQGPAQTSIQAIRDVVQAVRQGARLK